jgi:hypothetical protein
MEDLTKTEGLSLRQVEAEIAFLNRAIREGILEYGDYFTHAGLGSYLYVRREALKERYIELSESVGGYLTEKEKPHYGRVIGQLIYHALAVTGVYHIVLKILEL